MRVNDTFEQDEFLQEPALFKHGPRLLVAALVLVCVFFTLAYHWRVDTSRFTTYQTTFTATSGTASAVRENLTQLIGRLKQASHTLAVLHNTPGGPARVHAAFNEGLNLRADGIEAVAVNEHGDVIASTATTETASKLFSRAAQLAQTRATVRGATFFLPETLSPFDGHRVVPVVHRVDLPGDADYIVYLVRRDLLAQVARQALGERQGMLVLEDAQGGRVLDMLNVGEPVAASPVEIVTTPEDAMSTPLDFSSKRMLAATAEPDAAGLKVTFGIQESDALDEFKGRVAATWQLAIGVGAFCNGLLGLTAFALFRFASKETYLRRLATIDILTGLPNRRSFHELLAKFVSKSKSKKQPMGLAFVDLDNFKYVNDSMGHEVGDSLLKHVGEVLKATVRKGDRVCRLGGDEFTILLRDLQSAEEAQQIGDRMLEAVRQTLVLRGVEIQTKASMGIALSPQHASSEIDLMRFADTAMYRAKQQGKGCCVVYDESMAAQALAKAKAARDLERGIKHDELFLVYQPKFCLTTGALSGHEALVRWMHPERGMVFPGDFIGLAEESGLIVDLGNWVLERAVRQLREWHDAGEGWHKVAVNVSALQLRGDEFVTRVQRVLADHGVAGHQLQLELTESSLASDAKKAQSIIQNLRALGVSVAVDDFGTGYSSLGALQSFEIDCLKVDRSFINVIHTPQGEAICHAVVSLGHALNMRVVAEGVETADQRDTLIRLGCDEVQGYFFAKPLPAADAVAFGRSHGHATSRASRSRPQLVAA
jgi:diguanylate cyclase